MTNVIDIKRELDGVERELARYLEHREPSPPSETATRLADALQNGHRLLHSPEAADPATVTTWRISPALDELRRRKTISAQEYAAASKFLRDYYLGLYAGPKTSNFAAGGGSAQPGDRETRRVHHAREVEKAMRSVDPIYHPALAWLIASLGPGVPLAALGAYYAPDLGTQTQSARGGQALALCCLFLCRHYGMDHSLDVDRQIEHLSRMLVEKADA